MFLTYFVSIIYLSQHQKLYVLPIKSNGFLSRVYFRILLIITILKSI